MSIDPYESFLERWQEIKPPCPAIGRISHLAYCAHIERQAWMIDSVVKQLTVEPVYGERLVYDF